MKRKIVSVLLCVLLLASLLPVSAFADTTASGTCGANLTWTLDSNGTLTISGTGAMKDYGYGNGKTTAPWGNYCSSIKKVAINDGVTSIGDYAFNGCSSLTSVAIPNSVTSIGSGAFLGCSSLTNVTIPESVTSIEWLAFQHCSSLTSVTIPDSITSIGNSTFLGCDKLEDVYYNGNIASWLGIDFGGGCSNPCTNGSNLYFNGELATDIVIPDSVVTIGCCVFDGCSSLTSVTIPDSVTSIEGGAFENCSNIENVYYNGNVKSWLGIEFASWDSNPCYNVSNLYFNGELVTDVVIPDSITSIGNYAFHDCRSLTSITIPGSVMSIGERAFYNCSSLTSVTIPDSVTSIERRAFENCSSLTHVAIGNGVTSIGERAFLWCNKIKAVNYDGNIESWLGIDFADSGSNPCNGSTLYFKGELVTNVVIPDSITSIKNWAFYGWSGLTSVTIPNSVTGIGESAFYNCSSLTSVTIPDSVTSIGDWAFYNCSSLKSLTIPDSMTSIGDYAFRWCSKLNDIAFAGSKDAWASIEKGNEVFSTSPRIHYDCISLDGHIIPMERKDPSCTSTGYIKYICSCGYKFTETLPENHDYVFIKSVTATCSHDGYDVYKCSKCGKTTNTNYINRLPHDYELTKAVEPTCTEHGYDVYKCTVCGTSKTETRNDELLPHDYVVTAVEPTCTEHGYDVYKCTVCGTSKTEIRDDELLPHDYVATVVEPTCLKGGYTLHKCSVCGDEYKDNLTALLGHSMVEVSEKPATCTEAGHTAGVQCSRCGLVESGVTEIPALGHSYGAWTQTKAPTCTAKGTETRNCTRCNATQTRDVNALGHSYGAWTQTKAPTCTAKGTETQSCTRCNAAQTRDVNALGHSYANGKCTRCGAADPNYKPAPKAPELKITTSAGKPKIYWNAVDGAVKYWIYRSTDGKNFKYYDSTTKTSYTNNSTAIGSTYYYKVKSVGANGAKSDYSVSKGILCKPAAPTVSINRSNGKPKLSWKAVSGATKYWIYRSTDGVNFKYFDSTTKTSYTNSGAASGTKYYYRVKAVAVVNGKNVVSANSSTKSLMTSLAKPSVSITTSNGKPKLTWKAVTGADKYYIYRSTDGKNFSYFDSTTKTTYVNSGAKKNTKYYYKVKAVCASNSNANSAQSSAVSIKATK